MDGRGLAEGKGSSVAGRSVTINRPAAELYRYVRDVSNLPHVMENVVSIDVRSPELSHWVIKAPAGAIMAWDARVTREKPNRFKASTFLDIDRPHSIRQAIIACRKGGRVSMLAVYGGFVGKFPLGAFLEKGLALMVADHTKSTADVKAAGMQVKMTVLPPRLDAMGLRDGAAKEATRYRLYVRQQMAAHDRALALQKVAGKIAPVVETHIAEFRSMCVSLRRNAAACC